MHVHKNYTTTVIAKAIYTVKDMQEWAEAYGMHVRSPYGEDPPDVFPVNSAKALRGSFFAQAHGRSVSMCCKQFHFAIRELALARLLLSRISR
jgi:hypothetical protein